jgi:hypothetical protein
MCVLSCRGGREISADAQFGRVHTSPLALSRSPPGCCDAPVMPVTSALLPLDGTRSGEKGVASTYLAVPFSMVTSENENLGSERWVGSSTVFTRAPDPEPSEGRVETSLPHPSFAVASPRRQFSDPARAIHHRHDPNHATPRPLFFHAHVGSAPPPSLSSSPLTTPPPQRARARRGSDDLCRHGLGMRLPSRQDSHRGRGPRTP